MTIRTYQYQIQALITPSGGSDVIRNVEHTGVVTDEALGFVNAEFSNVTSDLALVDFAVFDLLLGGINSIQSPLGLEQTVKVFGYEYPISELELQGLAEASFPTNRSAQSDLFIAQDVEGRLSVRNVTIEQELNLEQNASRIMPLTVTSELNLVQSGSFTDINQQLELVQTVEWGYGYDAESELNLDTLVDKDQVIGRVVSHTNVVSQAAAWYVENRCNRFKFKTFHGEGGVAPSPSKPNYANTFLFYSQKDGTILQLRNPEMDDRRRFSFNRVNRSYFDGTLDLYTDQYSVIEQRQLYTIVANKREQLDALQDFLIDNLGLEVWVKDWRGVTWSVVVINPGEVYTEDSEGHWTFDFEVVGVPFDGEPVFQTLPIEDSVSRSGSIWLRSGSSALGLTHRANLEYDLDATSNLTADDATLEGTATFTIETP